MKSPWRCHIVMLNCWFVLWPFMEWSCLLIRLLLDSSGAWRESCSWLACLSYLGLVHHNAQRNVIVVRGYVSCTTQFGLPSLCFQMSLNTNLIVRELSRETNSCSAVWENSCHLWKPKVQCQVRKSPPIWARLIQPATSYSVSLTFILILYYHLQEPG